MFKLDSELIEDRIAAASFAFFTDQEIKDISVAHVFNTNAFDHLGKPLPNGIYDKAMGVSAMDHTGQCITCGLDSQFCPGHVGHIELTAHIYNPFLINHLYKLLKSLCIHCHRLRIHPSKIGIFIKVLKLIKAGDVIESNKLKSFLFYSAKQFKLLLDKQEVKALQSLEAKINDVLSSTKVKGMKDFIKESDSEAIVQQFRLLEKHANKAKDKLEKKMQKQFDTICEQNPELQSDICYMGPTSIRQKALKETIHEIWQTVVPQNCPHCNKKSPSYRKDGYTKFFQKPFSEKVKNQIRQQRRIRQGLSGQSSGGEDRLEVTTTASTGKEQSRKTSHQNEDELSHIDYEEASSEESNASEDEEELKKQKYMTPIEVKDHIDRLWKKENELLSLIFGRYEAKRKGEPFVSSSVGSDMFFLSNVIVPPNRFRPESQGGFGGANAGGIDSRAYLHVHSGMLNSILNINLQLKDALLKKNVKKDKSATSETVQKWIQLQDAVNRFMDSSMAGKAADKKVGGIRQLIEKKEGMFRMKMMGKRVNYGARSVISPDPYLSTDQIGVPVFMAKKLTFQESVCTYNLERLKRNVINGAKQHPGANFLEDEETGQKIVLDTQNLQERKALAQLLGQGRKIVYRHLQNGDVLLVNRQPTLHKPSIMAHIARILPKEQTIRFHYANCSTYNADFDGDEMNLHFPQNYLAISEAYKLMATNKQYIVPTSGKPLRGLIQDSVIAGVYLSSKDCYLTKEQYNQLVFIGVQELLESGQLKKVISLPPAILKPRPLYTGKQLISTLLKNIVNREDYNREHNMSGLNLESKSKLPAKEWGPTGKEEGEVIVRDNELLQGTLDKSAFGSTEFGLVHSFYEVYGPEKAGFLLTALARIFVQYLQTHGFTCSIEDLVLTKEFDHQRRNLIEQNLKEGIEAAADFCGLKQYQAKPFNYSNRIVFQSRDQFNQETDNFNQMSIPENPFDSKQCIQQEDPIRKRLEDKYNTTEDLAKLDQELDGVMKNKMSNATSSILKLCLPDGLVRKFPKNNTLSMVLTGAKGGVVNMTQIVCLLGQQELEGKRVPKMQNGKTLPCFLPYDPNPRSSGFISDKFITGLRPQEFYFHCMAGREGLIDTAVKTSRSGYLQRCLIKQLEALMVNYDMTVRDNDGSIIQFLYGDDGIDVINTKFLEKFNFLEQNFSSLMQSYKPSEILKHVDSKQAKKYYKKSKQHLREICKEHPKWERDQILSYQLDPVLSKFHPLKYFGAISEKMNADIKQFIKKDSQSAKLQKQKKYIPKFRYPVVDSDSFLQMYYLKYMTSVVHPGENVGTIAAQSVGEPSTQMTLNTFHLAGHGAGNMTLGIPRLKEILMTTPVNIKTPIMTVHFNLSCSLEKDQMESFASKFKRIKLTDLTKEVKVSQSIINTNGHFYRQYDITLEFEDLKKIEHTLGISFDTIRKIFQEQFLPALINETFKQQKKMTISEELIQEESKQVPSKSKPRKKKDQGEEGEEKDSEEEDEYLKKDLTQGSKVGDSDEGEEEDEEDDVDPEIDGFKKNLKEMEGYEEEDEDDQNLKKKLRKQVNAGKNMEVDQVQEDEKEEEDKKTSNLLSEKLQKFFDNIVSIDFKRKSHRAIAKIKFPLSDKKVLMLTLAEQILNKVLVRSVKGIEKCTLVQPQKEGDKPKLVIQGINFEAFYPYFETINVNRIETNDIWAMKLKYGIEACRANLVKEVRQVFGIYGIEVNYRHLSLIGDFMTFNGDYRAFNRIGMEESSSPFLKMSFETTMRYLINSCLTMDTDDMTTPSSCLVLGQVPRVGTGAFDIRYEGL